MFDLWAELQLITQYQYESKPGPQSIMGWAGKGSGRVTIKYDSPTGHLYFKEQGKFTLEQNDHCIETQNEFIWQRISNTRIRLFHSRFGRENKVELFDLVYDPPSDQWLSESAHSCGDDLYRGKAAGNNKSIDFCWSISGPRKQENLHYSYSR